MKQGTIVLTAIVCMLGGAIAMAGAPVQAGIEGKYIEVRSCDVFTASCFANSEIGLSGTEAIMAWDVVKGSHRGVDLEGLKVVAVVRASSTLGGTTDSVYPARSIVIVDERADEAQADALVDFAKEMAGQLLDDIIRVERSAIAMSIDAERAGYAALRAGDAVVIETRALNHHDMHCGNDEAYYAPLTDVDNTVVAFTERDMFSRQGLGVKWDESGRRSAWLGTFSR